MAAHIVVGSNKRSEGVTLQAGATRQAPAQRTFALPAPGPFLRTKDEF
jgi:hypothetical protein